MNQVNGILLGRNEAETILNLIKLGDSSLYTEDEKRLVGALTTLTTMLGRRTPELVQAPQSPGEAP